MLAGVRLRGHARLTGIRIRLDTAFDTGTSTTQFYVGRCENSAFKLPWIFLLLSFPLPGLFLFLLFGRKEVTRRMRRRFEEIDPRLLGELHQGGAAIKALEEQNLAIANQCRYIHDFEQYPVYQNISVRFYAEAANGFEAQLEQLAQVQRFIFMEYHTIEEGQSFARLKEVLADQIRHGVEVWVLYEDIASMGFLDSGFIHAKRELQGGSQSRSEDGPVLHAAVCSAKQTGRIDKDFKKCKH